MIYLEALGIGLSLALIVGPLLITIMDATVNHGSKAGYMVALGIWISDVIIAGMSLFFIYELEPFIHAYETKMSLGIAGAIILIALGISTWRRQHAAERQIVINKRLQKRNFVWRGFLVNTVNPFTFIFWIGMVMTYMVGRHLPLPEVAAVLGVILLVIVITDSAKVELSYRLSHMLEEHLLGRFNLVISVLLIVFGCLLAARVVLEFM